MDILCLDRLSEQGTILNTIDGLTFSLGRGGKCPLSISFGLVWIGSHPVSWGWLICHSYPTYATVTVLMAEIAASWFS